MDRLELISKGTFVRDKILLALAAYKFLTPSQMVQLSIASDVSYIRKKAKEGWGKPRPTIGIRRFPNDPDRGGTENFYFLTKYGLRALMEEFDLEENEILYLPGSKAKFGLYWHRKHTIYLQILLDQRAANNGIGVSFFFRDFDKNGNNRTGKNLESKTKIPLAGKQFFIPDGIFQLEGTPTPHKKELYLFEMYNGDDTKRVVQQLKKHGQAIGLGTPSIKFGLHKAHRVLAVFEKEGNMKAVLKRVSQMPYFSQISDYFLFKSLEELDSGNFFEGWWNLEGEKRGLYANIYKHEKSFIPQKYSSRVSICKES